MATTNISETPKVPGWEESLRSLVSADTEYIDSPLSESGEASLSKVQASLVEIHKILGTIAHALIVPDDIGKNILSLTEGWENFWLDYDILSAVHAPVALAPSYNVIPIDITGSDTIDVMAESFKLDDIPENLRSISASRRRLLKAASLDSARLILICARITAVDILLRQPKKSSVFLSSYFQSFPSFICQVASVANLMTSRAVSDSTPIKADSIESMIAFAAMSLLSTVITETNHVTQALSVLSANNPHSGILANLISLTLSSMALINGPETYPISKSAIYVLMSSVQNAKHPGTVANSTMLRKILETLVDSISHPEVTHACCVCLEVSLEFSPSAFTILFRDLEALDKLIDRAAYLVDLIKEGPETSRQKALSSVFSLLRFSFQTQEIHVGINLHEKLSSEESPLRTLLIDVMKSGPAVMGKNVFNGCITLIGNVISDDPTIISTLADCGIVEVIAHAGNDFKDEKEGDVLGNLFVALSALHLHDSGVKKLKEIGDPLGRLLVGIASDEFFTSAATDGRRRPMWGMAMNDENRIIEDIGMIAGQSCDDVIRNKPDMKTVFIERVIEGIRKLLDSPSKEDISIRIQPAMRMLYGGLLSTSEMVEMFVEKGGMDVLAHALRLMPPGVLIQHLPGTSRYHPLVSAFKSVGQRCGRPNAHFWQQPLANELKRLLQEGSSPSEIFAQVATICLLASMASPAPSAHGTTSETPSGSILYVVSELMRVLPDLFSVFRKEKESTPFMSASWVAIKNYVALISRVANSSIPPSGPFHGHAGIFMSGNRSIAPSARSIASMLVSGLLNVLEVSSPTDSGDLTELCDLASRILVEDKNHSIRPFCVDELWRQGGVDKFCGFFAQIVSLNSDPSDISAFESFLILFERITSEKRIMNASITRILLGSGKEFNAEGLNRSVTMKIGSMLASLDSTLLEKVKALSSTSATAIIKIYSHTVMLGDTGKKSADGMVVTTSDEEGSMMLPPPSVKTGTKRIRSSSPKRVGKKGRAAKKTTETMEKSDLISITEITDEIVDKYKHCLLQSQLVHSEYEPKELGIQTAKSICEIFVPSCISFGDKGGCESNVAELLNRHMDYLGVALYPEGSPEPISNVKFVTELAVEKCFEFKSVSACSILGSRINSDILMSKPSSEIHAYLESMISNLQQCLPAAESNYSWLGSVLSVIHPIVDFCVFNIDIGVHESLLRTLFEILKFSAIDDSFKSSTIQSVSHSSLVLISSMIRRKENMKLVMSEGLPVLLSLPAQARTVHTAPLLTDCLLGLVACDLGIAVKISKGIDAFTASDRSIEDFLESFDFTEIGVRDRIVFDVLAKQVLHKRVTGEDSVEIVRRDDAEYDFTSFGVSVHIEQVLLSLVDFLSNAITKVDKASCDGLGDLTSSMDGTYSYAITIESGLIAIGAILSEIALVREVDDRMNAVQERVLNLLVSKVGRCLVSELSQIKDTNKHHVGVEEKIFKLLRVWAEGINKCSPWLSNEVLGMVRDELIADHLNEDEDAKVLRSYGYAGLIFLLADSTDIEYKLIEELIPVLSARLSSGSGPASLCRWDAHYQIDGLYASLYSLATRLRESQIAANKKDDDSNSGISSHSSDDGDAEMSEDEDDVSEDMPEAFALEEEGEEEDIDEDEEDDIVVDEMQPEDIMSDDEQGENGESDDEESESDEDDESEDQSDYGEYDDFAQFEDEYDDYDVEWEEDDEDGEDSDVGDIVGEDGFVENPDDLGIEVADYMTNSEGGESGIMSSPLAGPEPHPSAPTPPLPSPRYSKETLDEAKQGIKSILENLEIEEPISSPDGENEEGEGPTTSEEEEDENAYAALLNMTEEEQLAGLSGLSPEERLSIQQALGLDDEDMGGEDDDDDFDDEIEFDLPPNVRITHGPIPMEMTLEVPRDMDARMQANVISEAINRMDMGRLVQQNGSSSKKSKGEFSFSDEIPKQELADKLCSDAPHRTVVTMSEQCANSLCLVAKASSRSLLLRNQISLKPVLDRMLVHLCFDPRTRNCVLENIFSSFLRFVFPNTKLCPWSFTSNCTDNAIPPWAGVYDAGLHPALSRELRSIDVNAPGQCRSVGSGRFVNTIKMILDHVPRARLWFSQASMQEVRTPELVALSNELSGRRTPERKRRTSLTSTPQEKLHYTSSDGEGPLVRAASSHSMTSGMLINPRKVSPINVCIHLLSSQFLLGSPSHSLILTSLVLQVTDPFPKSASDSSDCEASILQSVSEQAVQLLCEFLVDSKNRLRHMPEFDKAVNKVTQILVAFCRDVKMREVVRQRLLATASRLVADMLSRLNQDENFTAVPLVRIFRTAKEAFGTRRIENEEPESFLDFAPAVANIDSLWAAITSRLARHNNLLLGAPSIAQQALQRRRGDSGDHSEGSAAPVTPDDEKVTNKIAALETIAKLIPLVELFLNAHDVSHKDTKFAPSTRESVVFKKVTEFVENHRRPINAMVKSRPSILNRAFAPLVAICPHMLDFDNKRSFFRTKLRHQEGEHHRGPPPQLKLTVRRDDVFRDSYAKLQVRTKEEWRGRLNITFQGEEGVDAGGLVREWFSILAREIFNPNYALFTPASGRPSTFLINPASSVNPDHIHYFKFCGRFIGKAVYDNQRIDAYFVRSFYKHMLGKEVTWRDMEATDPEYFKSLNWILENDMTGQDLYDFTVEENEFGKLKVVELVPNGSNIYVSEENKHEFVRLVCEHKLTKGIQEQLKAFLQGFHELIPEHIVGNLFDDKELEMLISGLPTIDVEDLKRNTDYVHYTADSEQIKWFWKALEGFSEDELAWFMQFVTGSTQVPLEGFKGLAGMNGPQRFSIHRIRVEDRLPTAHTCYNQLDLPEYTSYEILEAKLKQAVREGHSGFGFI